LTLYFAILDEVHGKLLQIRIACKYLYGAPDVFFVYLWNCPRRIPRQRPAGQCIVATVHICHHRECEVSGRTATYGRTLFPSSPCWRHNPEDHDFLQGRNRSQAVTR